MGLASQSISGIAHGCCRVQLRPKSPSELNTTALRQVGRWADGSCYFRRSIRAREHAARADSAATRRVLAMSVSGLASTARDRRSSRQQPCRWSPCVKTRRRRGWRPAAPGAASYLPRPARRERRADEACRPRQEVAASQHAPRVASRRTSRASWRRLAGPLPRRHVQRASVVPHRARRQERRHCQVRLRTKRATPPLRASYGSRAGW